MVRLKVINFCAYILICQISIPYGAIKSYSAGIDWHYGAVISIPYGAIKSF